MKNAVRVRVNRSALIRAADTLAAVGFTARSYNDVLDAAGLLEAAGDGERAADLRRAVTNATIGLTGEERKKFGV